MEDIFWHKQTADKPLFANLLWARPENKRIAGKLLIVGGNKHGFAAPTLAFNAAVKAGVGSARVFLPDALRRVVGTSFAEAEFGASTPSGSFGQQALAQLLELAEWSDGVLLAGDFGASSETAILLEKFISKYQGQLTLTGDSFDSLINNPAILRRYNTVITTGLARLQKIGTNYGLKKSIKSSMDLLQLVQLLHEWTSEIEAFIVTEHAANIVVAVNGQISTSPVKEANLTDLAAYASVWWLQQPQKLFEALSTAVYDFSTSK
ncbi:TPA: hypothetical protein DIS56_03660 [Candidatus Saccharibacteria bacterium]|nr:MAG: hypothetical protein UX30_C0007G0118 [Candidatus Saccharibacteria bacterium GW2011_GWA2_46_10]OGL35866.1 MAG: hypothetical protein A3F05_00815 [Candidatus Saccharibacteria bacterium RIFCSPHIGHO2_12_FULL_47_17]HCM52196.1 hypothetical protein [Candidatus Saccharibacteria bacterium]